MFESLTSALQAVFRKWQGRGRLTEADLREAMREIRTALLEADVHYGVVKDFTARVTARCLGQEVLESITPGQQIVKRVHEELTALLSAGSAKEFDWSGNPATAMLLGLHGSGKTTTAAKLAAQWKKAGRSVLLVAADIRRPAAVEQLTVLAGQVRVEILPPEPGETVPDLGRRAIARAKARLLDTVLFDTGGRFQIDAELVAELKALREAIKCRNALLVVDAALGQESVHVAETFHRDVGLTGLILTKLDGDARGGAALSIQSVTGCPILFCGIGERADQLAPFHPERMASRILGMGDIVSLVEKAQQSVEEKSWETLEQKARAQRLDLEDFLGQLQQMRKMGPLDQLLDMLPSGLRPPPGARDARPPAAEMEAHFRRAEAIIRSMTPQERRHPEIINGRRRLRIARGSGTSAQDVNELLRQFGQMREMMRRMGRMQKKLQRLR